MPRFHLQLHECGQVTNNDEGQELPSLWQAMEHAVASARCIMSEEVLQGRLCLSCCIVIEDDQHAELMRVPFKDALKLSGQ